MDSPAVTQHIDALKRLYGRPPDPGNADAPPVARRGVEEAQTNGQGLRGNDTARLHALQVSAEPLLARLEGVQKAGNGWRARCPACGGASRKLSVAQTDTKVLVHCFACGDADAVLAAVNLRWSDLQPPRGWPESPEDRRKARRSLREAGWSAALQVLALESKVVHVAAKQVASWQPLSEEDDARLTQAVERITGAANALVEAAVWRPGGRQ